MPTITVTFTSVSGDELGSVDIDTDSTFAQLRRLAPKPGEAKTPAVYSLLLPNEDVYPSDGKDIETTLKDADVTEDCTMTIVSRR